MPAAPDFATRRFQSAASHYLAGRAAYPPELIRRTAEFLDLRPSDRLLDLGCGPAQLALAFAPLAGDVLALDPEPAMLELARRRAADVRNVTVAAGSSADLAPELGGFRAVLIGRAFHWMDRVETLRRLDELIAADGAVVLFGDERPDVPENAWLKTYQALLERYAGDDAERRRRRSDAFLPHLSVLLGSAFSRLERISVVRVRRFDLDVLIERALSYSSTSREARRPCGSDGRGAARGSSRVERPGRLRRGADVQRADRPAVLNAVASRGDFSPAWPQPRPGSVRSVR
jgi:SAM-dependent methyltransferase